MRTSFLVGAAVLSLAALDGVSAKSKAPVPTLTSIADSYTTLDQQKAAKTRKLAEYVIRGSQKTEERAESVIRLGDKKYTLWVAYSPAESASPKNLLSVWIRPAGTFDREYITTFSDEGLDGRCDFGLFGKKASETGEVIVYFGRFPNVKSEGWFEATREFWREYASGSIRGLEHQERFQKLYEETLERLIKFYESGERK